MKDENWHDKWDNSKEHGRTFFHDLPGLGFLGSFLWGKKGFRGSRLFKSWRRSLLFVDYDQTDEEYQLKIEVPGIEKDKISAKASGGSLNVEIEGESHHYPLPPNVRNEEIYATLKLGVLTVHMPKKEPDRKVDID